MEQNDIEMREAKSRQLHAQGNNCCQAVVLAYADRLPIGAGEAGQMAAAFGRGMSGCRQTCGCVSGMAMVCGLCGRSKDFSTLAKLFQEEHGSLNCAELLRLQGAGHSCNDLVASAARLLGEVL